MKGNKLYPEKGIFTMLKQLLDYPSEKMLVRTSGKKSLWKRWQLCAYNSFLGLYCVYVYVYVCMRYV